MKIVYTVVKDEEEAGKIAKTLVEERLVACANYFPIKTVYRWEGKVGDGQEVAMFLKTKKEWGDKVMERVKELHSYEVPCLIVLGVEKGNEKFLEWVGRETK